jgi:hypothetical protein
MPDEHLLRTRRGDFDPARLEHSGPPKRVMRTQSVSRGSGPPPEDAGLCGHAQTTPSARSFAIAASS